LRLTENTRFNKYLKYKLIAEFDDKVFYDLPIKLKFRRWHKVYRLPSSVWDIKFSDFIKAVNAIDSITDFLEQVTNVNIFIWTNSKIKLSLPLYSFYKDETIKILEMFKEVTEEAPKGQGTVKDMAEFGLTSLVDTVACSDVTKHDYVYNMTVADVFVEYKRKIDTIINTEAQQKYYAKNN